MRRGLALIWALVTAGIATVVGIISYQAGWAAGLASKLPEGTVPPYYYYDYGPHFGFGLIALLFFIFLLALLFRGGWRRGWGGVYRGNWGGGPPPQMEERLRDWHQRAHGDQPSSSGEKPAEGPGRQ